MSKLKFTGKQKFAEAAFKKYRNSIIIYTEDKAENEKLFYVTFFKKLLEGTDIEITDVFPIGSCDEVNNREKMDKNYSVPKIYITDGDIFLMYRPRHERKRYYPLPRYCIENYLIDEKQICQVAEIYSGKKSADEIKTEFDYSNILQDFAYHILPIFYYYSLLAECGKFYIDKYGRFYDNKKHVFLEKQISAAITNMRNELLARDYTEAQIDKKLKQREKKFPKTITSLKIVVSAKNFTFPYLKEALRYKCSLSIGIQNESWKFNCAKYIDVNSLTKLKNKIMALCTKV